MSVIGTASYEKAYPVSERVACVEARVVESRANEGQWRLSESIDAVIGMFRSK